LVQNEAYIRVSEGDRTTQIDLHALDEQYYNRNNMYNLIQMQGSIAVTIRRKDRAMGVQRKSDVR